MKRKWSYRIALLALLGAHAGLSLDSLSRKSATFDEPLYLAVGASYLTTGRLDLNPEHPPLQKILIGLAVLPLQPTSPEAFPSFARADRFPWRFAAEFLFGNRIDPDRLLYFARLPAVLSSLLLILLLAHWARVLYGPGAGIVAASLAAFSPNLLAHGRLATLDLAVTLWIAVCVYCAHRHLQKPRLASAILLGLSLGLALLTKFVAVLLLFVLPAQMLLHRWESRDGQVGRRHGFEPRRALLFGLCALVAAALLVQLIHGLPRWLNGFGLGVLGREQLTREGYESFRWGSYSATGFRDYYLFALLVKTPLPTLGLLGAAILRLFRGLRANRFRRLFLWLPLLAVLAITAPITKNAGLRIVLPALPFAFLLAAEAGRELLRWRAGRAVLALLLGWCAFGTLRSHPDYLPWFNELVGGPEQGIHYLDDSNVDWGQDLKALAGFVRDRRISSIRLHTFPGYLTSAAADYYGLPWEPLDPARDIARPAPGWYAVSAHLLQRPRLLVGSQLRYDWLTRCVPETVIGHSIYVYRF